MARGRRSKEGGTKRDREKQWHAWLDPQDPRESAVLDYAKLYLAEGEPPKRLIVDAVLALREMNEGQAAPLPATERVLQLDTQRYISTLLGAIDQLTALIGNIGHAESQVKVKQVSHTVQQATEEFTPIERSIAGRYQALSFDDDE